MSSRLDQEREERLQPQRIAYAREQIEALGYEVRKVDHTSIAFLFRGNTITVWPYSGWFSGRGVRQGRGLKKLLKQIKEN